MGLAAINSQANLLFAVFGLMIGVLLISGSVGRIVLKKLRLQRVLPENGVVGRPMTVTYEFENRKRFWPSFSVTASELEGVEAFMKQPNGYLLHVAPRQTAIVPVELIPRRRGLHKFGRYQVSTSFPFGFIRRSYALEAPDHLVVFPAIAPVDSRLLSLMRSAETSTTNMRPRRGGNDEFYGLKEFRSGESPRWIYWKRSARTGTLVSKEMTHVSPPKIMLLVDTFVERNAGRAEHAAVERAISGAASLASYAIEQGLPVGMLAWSGEWSVTNCNRGKRQKRDLLTALARLPVNHERDVRQLLNKSYELEAADTTAVLFTPHDVKLSLSEHARGGVVVVSPSSPRWIDFDAAVDYSRSMPPEHELAIAADKGAG